MAPVYTVAKLPADKVAQAFPLMRALDPAVSAEHWRAMYAAMERDGEGTKAVLVASGPQGHFRGLCIVEVRHAPGEAPAVALSQLLIDDVLEPDRVARAMLEALAAYCAAHDCERLQIALRGTDEATILRITRASSVLRKSSVTIELI